MMLAANSNLGQLQHTCVQCSHCVVTTTKEVNSHGILSNCEKYRCLEKNIFVGFEKRICTKFKP